MKVKVKSPWVDRKGLHKKGDIVEIETAAFNPILMAEIAESKVIKKKADEKTDAKPTTRKRKK